MYGLVLFLFPRLFIQAVSCTKWVFIQNLCNFNVGHANDDACIGVLITTGSMESSLGMVLVLNNLPREDGTPITSL